MTDAYKNFAELACKEKSDAFSIEAKDRKCPILIVAPHGGGIEPGTSEISKAIAAGDISYYLFEGRKRVKNKTLHITSSNFDEPICLALLKSADIVLTVHGEASEREVVYVGGRDSETIRRIWKSLEEESFMVCEHKSLGLQGNHSRNICNMGRSGAGVQLEISGGLRLAFFLALTLSGRQKATHRLEVFAAAIRKALSLPATERQVQVVGLRITELEKR